MPHLLLEYSDNVALPTKAKDYLKSLNVHFGGYETVKLDNIKSRATEVSEYCVAGGQGDGFVHLRCALLPGRSSALKDIFKENLLAFLKETIRPGDAQITIQFSVELTELTHYEVSIQNAT